MEDTGEEKVHDYLLYISIFMMFSVFIFIFACSPHKMRWGTSNKNVSFEHDHKDLDGDGDKDSYWKIELKHLKEDNFTDIYPPVKYTDDGVFEDAIIPVKKQTKKNKVKKQSQKETLKKP